MNISPELELEITFLGTGTSVGVPMIGCACEVCTSDDPRDKRSRSSIYVTTPEASWVVDTGPDFRSQCLREGITSLDAALFTHGHTDHIMGFDDLRRFTLPVDAEMPIYAREPTLREIERVFHFAFNGQNRYPSYLKPVPHVIDGPFSIGQTEITALPVQHGSVDMAGFLFSRGGKKLAAYISDCKAVPPETRELMNGVDTLIVDALRYKEHPTHQSIGEALALRSDLAPRQTYFMHFNCDVSHAKLAAELPDGVTPAYDGLKISFDPNCV